LVRLSGDDGVAYIEKKQFQPGHKMITQGRFDQMIYWLLTGEAQVVARIKGRPKIVHKALAGECIGAMAVIRGPVRSADVVTGSSGARVLELDWAITETTPELGKAFYHLIALNLADTLDTAYATHLTLIANAVQLLREKTGQLIDQNRKLERLLAKHQILIGDDLQSDPGLTLSQAIANLKESLSLLEQEEESTNLDGFIIQ
jgi:CRP-like cAMP-binding protein